MDKPLFILLNSITTPSQLEEPDDTALKALKEIFINLFIRLCWVFVAAQAFL